LEAEKKLLKARDLAFLLFGDSSRKPQEYDSILAEISTYRTHPTALPHLFDKEIDVQIGPQPIDPSKLDFCQVLYDFTPDCGNDVSGVDLDVRLHSSDLVAVLRQSDLQENLSEWWKC
jgi:hypothetical protein